MQTRITSLLGIRYPIVQGGMQWVGRAELAAAVSNAGGLGVITALTQPTPALLEQEIARCRVLTTLPFGVNLTTLPAINPPPYAEYLEAIIRAGVRIVETAGNTPLELVDRMKAAGVTIVHKWAIVQATERDTRLIFRTLRNSSRVLRNAVVDEVLAIENRPGGCAFEDIKPLVAGAKGRVAMETGDLHAGVITAGLVTGLIRDVPSCAELLETMVADCRRHLERARACFA